MACGSEHYTPNTRGVPLLRQQLQFRAIADRWPARIERVKKIIRHNKSIAARKAARREQRIKHIQTQRKLKAWKNQISHVGKKVFVMVQKYYTYPSSVTTEDWDKFVKGNFGKLQAHFKMKCPREKWPRGVPYLNFIARAKNTEALYPRSEWPKHLPYGNFTAYNQYVATHHPRVSWPKEVPYRNFKALDEYNEKHHPRAEWPKTVPYLDIKARDEYYELHHPRAKWPGPVPYLDFKALDKYLTLFPREDWPRDIPYLDWVALKPYALRVQKEAARSANLEHFGSPPSWQMDCGVHRHLPHNMSQQYPIQWAGQPYQEHAAQQYLVRFAAHPNQEEFANHQYSGLQDAPLHQEQFKLASDQLSYTAPSHQQQYTAPSNREQSVVRSYRDAYALGYALPSPTAADNGYVYPEPQFQSHNGGYYQQKFMRCPDSIKPDHHGLSTQPLARELPVQEVAQQYPVQPHQEQHAAEAYPSPLPSSPPHAARQRPEQLAHQHYPAHPIAQHLPEPHASHPTLAYRFKPPSEPPLMSEADIGALMHWNAQFY